jgi:hypothetical protein
MAVGASQHPGDHAVALTAGHGTGTHQAPTEQVM